MSDDMDAYRDVFVSESADYLQSIVEGVLALESSPNDLEPVETVFRGAHSLKGMAAAMGYDRTTDLTHEMEGLVDTVRRRERAVDHALVDLILRAVDTVKSLIADEMAGHADVDVSSMMVELAEFRDSAQASDVSGTRDGTDAVAVNSAGVDGAARLLVRVTLEDTCVLKSVRAYMVIKRLSHMGQVVETHPSARDIEDENFEMTFDVVIATLAQEADVAKAVHAVSEVSEVDVEQLAAPEPEDTALASKDAAFIKVVKAIPKISETQTVRIAIGHIDTMVNLVGELVIMRARLENLVGHSGDPTVLEALEELLRISSELQHEVMQTRMVPVGNIFNRFPRMVRDLALDLGKDVAFEMCGLDIELDRTVLDEIGDPLVHLLRNALDHGIEPAADRVRGGKPARGTVRLAASRERDQVRLIVSDDGRGMDAERIWAKAVDRGMVSADARDSCTTEDILLLTCLPGFTTAEVATRISGRGVGMDVVRGKIEYLGGSLTIRSTPGEGTEFTLSLPLTLAIIQALLVTAGDQVFALPLSFVTEVFAREDVDVDTVEGSPIMSLRDGTVAPLYRLDVLIGAQDDPEPGGGIGEHVVLIEVGDQMRALTVNGVVGRQEIVIKPLAKMLKQIRGLGGATVLGDGSVALILDPRLLFTMGDSRT